MGTSVNGKSHFMTPLVDEKAISSNGKIVINSKFIGDKKLSQLVYQGVICRGLWLLLKEVMDQLTIWIGVLIASYDN